MAQITEDYCSFELSKLLKEKGFDIQCDWGYSNDGDYFEVDLDTYEDVFCYRPSLYLACKWLREIHGLHIWTEPCFDYDSNHVVYLAFVQNVADVHEYMDGRKNVFTYPQVEKATSEALKYCLENLI